MHYEAKRARPISNRQFAQRMVRHGSAVIALVLLSLAAGMWGYAHYEHLEWRDAFLNASMLLGGMGPVNRPLTPGGKLFAGCYALYAGLVFIVCTGILFAPVVHRVIHHFHFADGNQS